MLFMGHDVCDSEMSSRNIIHDKAMFSNVYCFMSTHTRADSLAFIVLIPTLSILKLMFLLFGFR